MKDGEDGEVRMVFIGWLMSLLFGFIRGHRSNLHGLSLSSMAVRSWIAESADLDPFNLRKWRKVMKSVTTGLNWS